MAAHAASMMNCDVRIFSKPRKSYMRGAQYLHAPIPLATKTEAFDIHYKLIGSADVYKEKVYGVDLDVEISPNRLSEWHEAWDIREAYDWLWETYGGYVYGWEATPANILDVVAGADLVISSIPAPLLCRSQHGFAGTSIWATDKAFDLDIDNTVLCDGTWDRGWYRSSLIQGEGNTEWPFETKPPLGEDRLWEVQKPTASNCDCWPGILRVGRYGSWKKAELSHEAYFKTVVATSKLLGLTDAT